MWNKCLLWKEYGVEYGTSKFKGRLYAWFGAKPGFGYNNIWIDAQEWPLELLKIVDAIKINYSNFETNGCLVTVYPKTAKEDLDNLTNEQLVLKGMNFHQVVLNFLLLII